ncbi:DHA2 family efflux MFS transporter permease subunit [Gluconobacter wancherniae]|uniref:MFS transporter n=1 Tax=Gluconobacter wancherniae NBRC 103581 TaxID=656744 RepID=A0A511B0I0_9PROT|nr:DHA2 family efflux MFS transporter permease subunit [Gluconobacter wancherniae]MBF0854209.1 DHA2 family efflux MFS transporter permease subunit [Gluconobacter wancherniae]MBS1062602.1 DHA2 family efflux MFS transporter permease subunit [Gluconobacter wancherniae]MBS1088661.1 DHA2 family efflux MFS transporter permease subunit [Gluconobacter wancherniae]MBS1094740.1 DHA2 family efflux MFS transporter permease subunit [Gluconobacter wancherniae]GBD57266.1 MFS transporter [Gluconobacter wanche
MSKPAEHHDNWKPSHNPWLVAVTVTLAAFMEVLDTTIVNVAMPHIAGSLGSSYDDATWALTSYLVANGIVLTISSWLSRLFGRKRYFLICISMFTVSSFLCGLATSLPMLIVFRLMQGFFGGGLQPSQQSIILDTFPPEKRGAAFGLTAIATIVGPVLGPMLGGYLTDNLSWRWIFFVNIPFGIITVLAVTAFVEDPPWERKKREPVDVIGICLVSLGLGCLEVMCDRGQDDDWFGSSFIITMAVLGVVGVVGAIIWLCYAKNPLVRLTVMKDRNFATGMFLISMVGALLYASAIIVPQFAQQVLGYTATTSGLLLAPGGVAVICLIPLVGKLMGKVQLRYLIAFGFFSMGMAMFTAANLYAAIDFKHLMLYRIGQTACLAFLFVPISTVAYSTLPRELNSDASALFSMARNYVGSLAISLATAALIQVRQKQQNYQADNMISSKKEVANYVQTVQQAAEAHGMAAGKAHSFAIAQLYQEFTTQVAMKSYNEIFNWIGVMALCVVPLCFLLSSTGKKAKAEGGAH